MEIEFCLCFFFSATLFLGVLARKKVMHYFDISNHRTGLLVSTRDADGPCFAQARGPLGPASAVPIQTFQAALRRV